MKSPRTLIRRLLAAARNAVKSFTSEPQPDDAVNVKTAAAWNAKRRPVKLVLAINPTGSARP